MRWLVAVLVVGLISSLVALPPALAAVVHTTFPVAGTLANPCTGEVLTFAGAVDVVIGQSPDATGELEITLSSNFRGITAVGLLLGTQYQIASDSSQVMSIGLPPVTIGASNDFRLIGGAEKIQGSFPLSVSFGANGAINTNAGPLQLVCG
ncbi:MAG TPA: hypothetical protein VGT02_18060 [Methylomirabilota bacterium]|jgi:hypothetical protein|nr:hypothetical protein [Methylomirabilota bacterium]